MLEENNFNLIFLLNKIKISLPCCLDIDFFINVKYPLRGRFGGGSLNVDESFTC